MNWEQLKAIIWLRSRLSLNQWRKGGAVNFVLMMILVIGLLVFAAISFFASVVLGIFLLPQATPNVVMIVWDVMIGVLLFSWLTSLLVEIQRMELLSLEKLLHLPMTLRDAFLLNYLSSIVCLNIVCFVPAAVGLSIALAITKGPQLLFMLPLVISFVLMLTAVTYQLRGWLSSLMSNKRRQRTVVVAITMGFIAFAQLPNVVIQLSVPDGKAKQKQVEEYQKKEAAITELLTKGEITLDEHTQRTADLKAANAEEKARAKAEWNAKGERMLTLCNQVLPVGWLAYASRQLIVGPLWPAFLCFAAMTSIGSLSLWRSYKATIRFYTGNQVRTKPATQAAIAPTSDPLAERPNKGNDAQRKPLFVERSLPKVSEHSAAVALTSMQGMLRAPEMKMMLIGPAMLGGTAIFMVATNRIPKIPLGLDPFVWVAGIGVLTFMSMMLMMNIFGMDRNGFRCYVLMPIERSELLIGKNLAVLPIVLSLFVCFAGALLYFAPVGPLSILGHLLQMAITFMLASLVGNWVSICFPIAMAPGTGKPAQVNWKTVVAQMLVVLGCPLFVLPAVVFVAIEWGIKYFFQLSFFPIYPVLSAVEFWLVLSAYRYAIGRQGQLLQSRETKILEVLTTAAE